MKASECRYCGARIVWVKMTSGKSMPCDAPPETAWGPPRKAIVVATANGEGFVVGCKTTVYVYSPHWASCPNSKEAAEAAKQSRATKEGRTDAERPNAEGGAATDGDRVAAPVSPAEG